ncbi:benzoate 4-monooxygenase cytochrome P450 [Aspergillus avenaceus]|uniref:Benzoate 4-monooxygenase cytochrome P450 n=1 Tax=Aspergillus avenaceus TaxID=36643 RepID=A0A5N6U9L3_ASPAV|nr:benzoate 4-monooxygenase cytochrome P450 [Aspergillus avenaceus]
MWVFLFSVLLMFLMRNLYRLYLHPLSKVPGPKLAAVSHLVEFYYDVLRGGKYLQQVENMHKVYGPVVRISPSEVHVSDPRFYTEVYSAGGRKRNKSPKIASGLRAAESLPAIINHDHHNLRRRHLNPPFSKPATRAVTPTIQSKIEVVTAQFVRAYMKDPTHALIDLDPVFTALTADIVTQFTFGKDLRFLEDQKFNNVIVGTVREMTGQYHVNRFFPWLSPLLDVLPPWFMYTLRPKLAGMYEFQNRLNQQPETKENGSRALINVLSDPSRSPEERSPEFIRDNINILLGAATDTTSGTLLMGLYYLAQNRSLWLRVRQELGEMMPTPDSPASWPSMEKLPLLHAVFNETLRLGPISIRSARVPVDETLVCHGHSIPPGTCISMSARILHMNTEAFPDPYHFDPDRWLRADQQQHVKMMQALVPFGKGNRDCIGRYLATAEIYMILASIIRRFDVELYDTTPDDVAFTRDYIVGRSEKGVWQVKIRITGVVEN